MSVKFVDVNECEMVERIKISPLFFIYIVKFMKEKV